MMSGAGGGPYGHYGSGAGGGVGEGGTTGVGGAMARELSGVTYLCGDCGAQNVIKNKDPIRCRQCNHRIMYKMRTKRVVQFEAR
ncbi:DNA-directed RNA polymerases I, II, and III subunit RPABC4 [Nannochloropsis gaditana CCMP526]|uniref:DNA-directed RNA polymerases I, II, and III subunit RPABC4 n=1 Tax=Nannochloropsis gaditana (strain CCMP526) TaxID=1093141 RepID=UPI00029F7426|nr:DNA-directed RNA polymerases I, II, and III subunit RPABC4 [Nannochloropsis gaditana CCMP526]EKU22387.1 DNA-directed RNA polymerases I, II, and III subunit RPABC4 [Nannochloropsis gaditana CCMP526]|eukprot:XP_005853971.1 DNA-directed RNA polymerases I, II, and III subunit RPABC4 [Nannochloropsis gaditana CCMP526]